VAGFSATLEEIRDASVLLHVADISSPSLESHIDSVRDTLKELGLADKPECLILNKADRLPAERAEKIAQRLDGIAVSAVTGAGLERMLARVEELAFAEPRPHDEPIAQHA
jgi:GTP-binding protein HflX